MSKIIAHRGYSARFRENSMPAWLGAIEAGADLIEIDVRLTRDSVFVCAHDPDLRLAGHKGVISEMHWAEIEVIKAGGEPVAPRLADAINDLPVGIPLLLDVKDERPETLKALLGVVSRSTAERLVLGLHKIQSVQYVRRQGSVKILGLLDGSEEEDDLFFESGGNILRLWESMIREDRIERLRDDQREIWMTTGGWGTGRDVGEFSPENLQGFAKYGISGFLVNDPAAGRQALGHL